MDDFLGRRHLIPPQRLRELTRRSDRAGAVQCAGHLGAIACTGWALLASWGSAWAAPVFILHGMLINYLFAAQHECNHYTAFETRWMNDVVNRITGFVLLYPRSYERWYHFEHHRHTQDWERDPELMGRSPYRLGDYLLYLLGPSYWWSLVQRLVLNAAGRDPGPWCTAAQRRHVRNEARWHLAGYAAVLLVSLAGSSWLAVQLWLAPMLSTKVLHQVQNITEHTGLSHEPDTVHNTRTIRTWAALRWMAWNMQYHTAHHTYPAVPFHRLPALHRELVQHLGYEPPLTGYLAFQRGFLATLLGGPEPVQGQAEAGPGAAADGDLRAAGPGRAPSSATSRGP
jgi:fatty acid desaturase